MRDVRSSGQTVHSGAAAVQTTVPSLLSGPARLLLGGEGGRGEHCCYIAVRSHHSTTSTSTATTCSYCFFILKSKISLRLGLSWIVGSESKNTKYV